MRLTLRTLLSYLDDTLEPSQAKVIGAKVAVSEQARDLMERIKQVTRRRKLTTPPTSGPGGMDANTIAEYLDNEVTPETATEVEQICLASDVHLAELAACHQILTLVLGEPNLVPPSAKQRMYGLVNGPESIPFRKPAKTASKEDNDLSSEIELDHDDTVRMEMPSVGFGGTGRNIGVLFGGVLVVCLLGFAVWVLSKGYPFGPPTPELPQYIAQGDKKDAPKDDDKKKPAADKDKNGTNDKKDDQTPPKKDGDDKKTEIKIEKSKVVPPEVPPYLPASTKYQPIGKYVVPDLKEPGVLLQKPVKGGWQRLLGTNPAVISGFTLLSLSGSKSVINLDDTGIELTLWGNLPELTLDGFVLESRAMLHVNALVDADVTLERGRIILRNNKKTGKGAIVRVRFNNPTLSREEHLDIVLEGSGSAVIVERFCGMDPEEPFFFDPEDKLRKGPIAHLRLFAYEQSATVMSADSDFPLTATKPILQWRSRTGVLETPEEVVMPPWFKSKGAPQMKDTLSRDKAVAAHKLLAALSEKKAIGTALDEILQTVQDNAPKEILAGKVVSPDTYNHWRHAIRSYAATDDLARIVEQLGQDKTPIYIRGLCMQAIEQWMALGREQDYALLEVLKKNYKQGESIKIMELLHPISTQKASDPDTYQHLIEGLNNERVAIRVLSHRHLIVLVPTGAKIVYDPDMLVPARVTAQKAWTTLMPRGQLPKTAAPTKDKK